MNLDQQQMARVVQYLQRWQPAQCGVCRNAGWNISPTVFQFTEYGAKGPQWVPDANQRFTFVSPQVFPVITLICNTCGNTLLISAVAAGVVASEPAGSPSIR